MLQNSKTLISFIVFMFAASFAFAGTYTPNFNLYKPDIHEKDWGQYIDGDLDIIDSAFANIIVSKTAIYINAYVKGDGTDETVGLQSAIDSCSNNCTLDLGGLTIKVWSVYIGDKTNYRVQNGTILRTEATDTSTHLVTAVSTTNLWIDNVTFDGNGLNQTTEDHALFDTYPGDGAALTDNSGLVIANSHFVNNCPAWSKVWQGDHTHADCFEGIRLLGTKNFVLGHNDISLTDMAMDLRSVDHGIITRNTVSNATSESLAFWGSPGSALSKNVLITDNFFLRHPVIRKASNIVFSHNIVGIPDQNTGGLEGGYYSGYDTMPTTSVEISNNIVYGAINFPSGNCDKVPVNDLTIKGNKIYAQFLTGITACGNNVTVSDNDIYTIPTNTPSAAIIAGAAVSTTDGYSIDQNHMWYQSGIAPPLWVEVQGHSSNVSIHDNFIHTQGHGGIGVFAYSEVDMPTMRVFNNDLGDSGIWTNGANPGYQENNTSTAAYIATVQTSPILNLTFGISTISNIVSVTGGTNITSIVPMGAGKKVTLKFYGSPKVVNGSNLVLDGDFNAVPGARLTLISDGTNWNEVSRSPASIPAALSSSSTPTFAGVILVPTGIITSQTFSGTGLNNAVYSGKSTTTTVPHTYTAHITSTNALFQEWIFDAHFTNRGSGYQAGDTVTIGSGGGSALIKTVDSNGAVLDMTTYAGGSGYSIASGVTTAGGHGAGLLVNITVLSDLMSWNYDGGAWHIDYAGVGPHVLSDGVLITFGTPTGHTINDTWLTVLSTTNATITLQSAILTLGTHINLKTAASTTLASCGDTPSLATGSNDFIGTVTAGTGAPTSCTVTFGKSYANTPVCVPIIVGTSTAVLRISAQTSAGFVVSGTATFEGFNYHCIGMNE